MFFIRDREQHEVDFLYTIDDKIEDMIEVNLKQNSFSPSLLYMAQRLSPKRAIQIVGETQAIQKKADLYRMGFQEYFANSVW